jgi:hypothetical protein
MNTSKILVGQRDWRIGRIPFAQKKFRPTGYQGKGIGWLRDGSNLSREQRI